MSHEAFTVPESSLELLSACEASISTGINELIDAATERAELLSHSATDDSFLPCKTYMKGYVTTIDKIRKFKEAFKEVKAAQSSNEVPVEFKQSLMNLYKEKCENCSPPESQYGYKAMIAAITDISSEETRVSQEIVDDEDGDLMSTRTITIPIDPITKQEVSNPVRNKLCGHKYDRASITEHIHNRRRQAKCPMMGCGQPLTEDLLEIDEETLLLLNRKRRRGNIFQ